jgi:uncharacterized RDD family membrane protein YckC
VPPPLSPGGQPLADFGTRLLAHLIDGAIVTAVAMLVFIPVIVIVTLSVMGDAFVPYDGVGPAPDVFGEFVVPLLLIEAGLVLLLLAAYYVYYVEMMHRSGQTVGKKAMKVRVVPLDPAATLTRRMAAKRYAVEFVGGTLVPFFTILDGLWQIWDEPYQQTLHDKAAQTVVVKVSA